MMNKKGAFTDLFIFMIVALIIIFVSGMYIYMSGMIKTELKQDMAGKEIGKDVNYTQIVDNTIGAVDTSYQLMYWLSIFIIIGMVISIFVGSYMVETRPVFFVPYIFISIIAVLVSVGISNAYQLATSDELLAGTFAGFVGGNYLMYYLPIWISAIAFIGGIIMFARMKSAEYGGGMY